MTPFYVVARNNRNSIDEVTVISKNLATQKEALDFSKNHVTLYGSMYIFECVGKVVIPRPEPVVEMKGDK